MKIYSVFRVPSGIISFHLTSFLTVMLRFDAKQSMQLSVVEIAGFRIET